MKANIIKYTPYAQQGRLNHEHVDERHERLKNHTSRVSRDEQ